MTEKNNLIHLPSELQEFPWPTEFKAFESRGLGLYVKRDDLIHPEVSGNKWRKLKYNIEQAKQMGKSGILTFGGAYSNHVLATAVACAHFGLKSAALIRGEELNTSSNEMLKKVSALGMELKFISRDEYHHRNDFDYLKNVKNQHPDHWVVPEGGKNFHGVLGCQEITREIEIPLDHLWVAQGTCTTAAGLLPTLGSNQQLHVVPALKGFDVWEAMRELHFMMFSETEWKGMFDEKVVTHPNAHFGGYGKSTPELTTFIQQVHQEIGLPLDFVYTGKTFWALCQYYAEHPEIKNKAIVFLHTGGLMNG